MRLKGDTSTEFRFELIVKLSEEGKPQVEIASLVNCSQAWVSKVLIRYKTLGESGLKVKGKAPGKASYLKADQLESLKSMLLQGALQYGFATDNWTRERIAELIQQQFEVSYHPSHISKVMKKLVFTQQKPKRRSYRKDDQAVEDWRKEQLPKLKKSP